MADWKDFERLCEDIKKNPDKYNWIVFDPIEGVSFRKGSKDGEN
jgi:hypothetical protein